MAFKLKFGKKRIAKKTTTYPKTTNTYKVSAPLKINEIPMPSVSRSKVVKRKKRLSGNDVVKEKEQVSTSYDDDDDLENNIIDQVIDGDIDKIKKLINSGVNLNEVNRNGKTPLIIAIEQDKPEIAELLIKSGADVNLAETEFGKTPLFCAISSIGWVNEGTSMYAEFLSLIKTLIKSGADVNKATYNGLTSISIAIDEGDENVKKLVLNQSTSFGKRRSNTTYSKMSLKTIDSLIKMVQKM